MKKKDLYVKIIEKWDDPAGLENDINLFSEQTYNVKDIKVSINEIDGEFIYHAVIIYEG